MVDAPEILLGSLSASANSRIGMLLECVRLIHFLGTGPTRRPCGLRPFIVAFSLGLRYAVISATTNGIACVALYEVNCAVGWGTYQTLVPFTSAHTASVPATCVLCWPSQYISNAGLLKQRIA